MWFDLITFFPHRFGGEFYKGLDRCIKSASKPSTVRSSSKNDLSMVFCWFHDRSSHRKKQIFFIQSGSRADWDYWLSTHINQKHNVKNTFSDGCLGSHNDEERSEMRYVMRIAESSESSKLWTHLALPFGGVCLLECLFIPPKIYLSGLKFWSRMCHTFFSQKESSHKFLDGKWTKQT